MNMNMEKDRVSVELPQSGKIWTVLVEGDGVFSMTYVFNNHTQLP
jgi:hypothetical protein